MFKTSSNFTLLIYWRYLRILNKCLIFNCFYFIVGERGFFFSFRVFRSPCILQICCILFCTSFQGSWARESQCLFFLVNHPSKYLTFKQKYFRMRIRFRKENWISKNLRRINDIVYSVFWNFDTNMYLLSIDTLFENSLACMRIRSPDEQVL